MLHAATILYDNRLLYNTGKPWAYKWLLRILYNKPKFCHSIITFEVKVCWDGHGNPFVGFLAETRPCY